MPLRIRPMLSFALAVLCASASCVAWAQDGRGGRGNDRGDRGDRGSQPSRDAGAGSPRGGSPRSDGLGDSVRRIERSTRSQVLSAERMQSDGRDVNRIKVVDDRGRVRVYMDDPQQSAPRTRDNDD